MENGEDMIGGGIFKGVKALLPQSLKKAIRKVINGSADTTINDSFFCKNEISVQIKKTFLIDEEWELLKKSEEDIKISEHIKRHPLAFTHRVSFELSNLCDYAKMHKKCPLNLAGEPEILPAKVVFDGLGFMAKYDFQGKIAFHNYNEPLIDPRLFVFVKYARSSCPDSDIYLCTNGSHLTQNLANELVVAGVSSIHVSAYSRGN